MSVLLTLIEKNDKYFERLWKTIFHAYMKHINLGIKTMFSVFKASKYGILYCKNVTCLRIVSLTELNKMRYKSDP